MSNLWPEKSDSPAGKGSKPRPFAVSRVEYDRNYERIFGNKDDRWISVDDELPKVEGRYEFKIDGVPANENSHWDSKDFFDPECGWQYDWYTVGSTRVTHWKRK